MQKYFLKISLSFQLIFKSIRTILKHLTEILENFKKL